jgi:hypothetical protein
MLAEFTHEDAVKLITEDVVALKLPPAPAAAVVFNFKSFG